MQSEVYYLDFYNTYIPEQVVYKKLLKLLYKNRVSGEVVNLNIARIPLFTGALKTQCLLFQKSFQGKLKY